MSLSVVAYYDDSHAAARQLASLLLQYIFILCLFASNG